MTKSLPGNDPAVSGEKRSNQAPETRQNEESEMKDHEIGTGSREPEAEVKEEAKEPDLEEETKPENSSVNQDSASDRSGHHEGTAGRDSKNEESGSSEKAATALRGLNPKGSVPAEDCRLHSGAPSSAARGCDKGVQPHKH